MLTGLDLSAGRPQAALARYRQYWPGCFDDEPTTFCPEFSYAPVLQALGETEKGERMLEASWSGTQDWMHELMHERYAEHWRFGWFGAGILDVAVFAMLGRKDEALDALEDAVEQGYRGWKGCCSPLDWQYDARFDASLDSIRGDPRFEAAFAVIEADMARQLESVRAMERSGEIPTLEALRTLRRK